MAPQNWKIYHTFVSKKGGGGRKFVLFSNRKTILFVKTRDKTKHIYAILNDKKQSKPHK